MHMHCIGKGSPAVIFIHGFGGFSLDWNLMHPKISEFTKSCVFDRDGYGWSEFGPTPRDGNQFLLELNSLLKAENISNSNIILVAHSRNFSDYSNILSVGGALVRAYYPTNKEKIKGMFLLDALDVNEPNLRVNYEEPYKLPVPFYAYIAGILSGMGFNFVARSVVDLHDFSDENVNTYHHKTFENTNYVKAAINELEDFPLLFSQANQTKDFGDTPLIVYGAGNGLIKSMGLNTTKLVRLSTKGEAYNIEESPHSMQFIEKYATLFNIHVIQMVFSIRNKN